MSESVLAHRRILVVEDEFFIAEDLEAAFTAIGAVVVGPTPSVEAALDLLKGDAAPDAAVLDVNLGGDMAYPVADALLARGVPFLFTTGYDRASLPERYAAVPRLEKPVDTTVILSELKRQLIAGA